MHVVWIYSSDYFLSHFSQVELSHFSGIIYNKVNGISGNLVVATPTIFTTSLETSQEFWSQSEYMHVVWI